MISFPAVLLTTLIVIMAPFDAAKLRARASSEGRHLGFVRAVLIAIFGVGIGLLLGGLLGYAVMFGPSYATGDFIGWPWITALPAVVVGLCVARLGNRVTTGALYEMLSRRL